MRHRRVHRSSLPPIIADDLDEGSQYCLQSLSSTVKYLLSEGFEPHQLAIALATISNNL